MTYFHPRTDIDREIAAIYRRISLVEGAYVSESGKDVLASLRAEIVSRLRREVETLEQTADLAEIENEEKMSMLKITFYAAGLSAAEALQIVSQNFESAMFTETTGIWKGELEQSYTVVVIDEDTALARVGAMTVAERLRVAGKQSTVLVTFEAEVHMILIERKMKGGK